MDLQTLLGDAYKDEMTIEEINTALADKNLVDSSTLPKSVNKDVFDKTASELSKVKKELKKLQEESMTAEERLQAENEKAQNLQQTYAKELAKLKAKELFVKAGLGESEYESLLDSIASEDEDITISRAQTMIKIIDAQKQAVEKSVKAELLKGTPKPPAGEGGNANTANFEKQIEKAYESGDMVTVASLTRQKQILEKQNQGG